MTHVQTFEMVIEVSRNASGAFREHSYFHEWSLPL
jgi:hypothetical protein